MTAEDLAGASRVCLVGQTVLKNLFVEGQSPVGARIFVKGVPLEVIGVLEAKGQTLGGDQDRFLAAPLTTGLNRFGARYRSLNVLVQVRLKNGSSSRVMFKLTMRLNSSLVLESKFCPSIRTRESLLFIFTVSLPLT